VNFMVGAEASPHGFTEFQSDNRWNLGFERPADGRYGTVQIFADPANLAQTPLSKAMDSAYGRATSGVAAGSQMTRFEAKSSGSTTATSSRWWKIARVVLVPDSDAAVATIFAPDDTVVKESFVVANGDIWSNVAPFQGGFAVRASRRMVRPRG
jgi:hypothetical protein